MYLYHLLLPSLITIGLLGFIISASKTMGKWTISKKSGKQVIQSAIFAMGISTAIYQLFLHTSVEISKDSLQQLLYISGGAIAVGIFPIGLEIKDFGILKKPLFWLLIVLLIINPGVLCHSGNPSLKFFSHVLLLATMSLAVLSVLIEDRPELLHTNIIKTLMMTGGVLDVILWMGIGIEETIKAEDATSTGAVIKGILPQLIVLLAAIFAIVWGKVSWWNKQWVSTVPSLAWLAMGMIVAILFKLANLGFVLGSIFGALIVPEERKHDVSEELKPLFRWAMLIYMSTVGFKVDSPMSLEAFESAFGELIKPSAIGKGIAIIAVSSLGLFRWKQTLHAFVLVCGGGSMIVAAASEMLHADLIEAILFQAAIISALFWAVLGGVVMDKFLLDTREEEFKEKGALLIPLWIQKQKHVLLALMLLYNSIKENEVIFSSPSGR